MHAKEKNYEQFYWRNHRLFMRCLHNIGVSATGFEIYFYEKCIWAFFVDVYYILYRIGFLDIVWCIFTFFSNNIVQQYNFAVQRHYIVYDYQGAQETQIKKMPKWAFFYTEYFSNTLFN